MVEKVGKKGANHSISSSLVLILYLSLSYLLFVVEARMRIPAMIDFLRESRGGEKYSLMDVAVGTGMGSHP